MSAATTSKKKVLTADDLTGSTATARRSRASVSPLVWTPARDLALVSAFEAGNNTLATLTSALKSDPAFTGEESRVTLSKVALRVAKLRKLGVKDANGVGIGFRKSSKVDVEALNAVLAGGAAETATGSSATPATPEPADSLS